MNLTPNNQIIEHFIFFEHKTNLMDDQRKVSKENGKFEFGSLSKDTIDQVRKSQIIKYDKLLICCRRLLFTFTESQQTLRRAGYNLVKTRPLL